MPRRTRRESRRPAGSAAPREGGVHPGGGAVLERQKFGFVVSGSAEALEIARVRQRRAPVIGETLEVGRGERIQVLTREGHDAIVAQRIEKDVDLFRFQRLAEIDSTDPDPCAAVRQGGFAAHMRAERLLQPSVDRVTHSSWTPFASRYPNFTRWPVRADSCTASMRRMVPKDCSAGRSVGSPVDRALHKSRSSAR